EKLRFNVSKKGFWENYSQVPDFKGLLRSMLNNHASLMAMVSDNKRIEGLSQMALWRFFQVALLWEAGTREEAGCLMKALPKVESFGGNSGI
ncbi:unnamed protein product, partial [marine sediment metagenome]